MGALNLCSWGWGLQIPKCKRHGVGCQVPRLSWAGSHHTVIPGDVVEGFLVVEVQEADGEQRQQCGQCHVSPQEGEGRPHQAAQLVEHLSPEPG